MREYSKIMIDFIVTRIKGILLNPVETFRQSKDEESKAVLAYLAVLVIINSLFFTISVKYMGSDSGPAALFPGLGGFFITLFFVIVISPFVVALSIVWLHLWVYILGGRKGIIQTARAFVYSLTPNILFGWIPYISFIFVIWSIILNVLGIRELHQISTARAVIAYLIAFVIPLIFLLFILLCLISHMNTIPAVAYTP